MPLTITRRAILRAAPAITVGLSLRQAVAATRLLRVGFQKGEPILMLAKSHRALETALNPLGIEVQWTEFQFGPPMLEAMRAGAIDIGAVGDTPPVFAQAAHGDLLYLAATCGAPQAFLLPPGSPIRTIADLRGKRVAFGRGSSAHNFVLMVLEKAGLTYQDIQPIYLGPADAGAAFTQGAIDAWSIWQPYTSLFDTKPGVRTMTTNKEIGQQYSYMIGYGGFVRDNATVVRQVLDVFTQTAVAAREHHDEVAGLLATATGMSEAIWLRALTDHPFDVIPMSDELTRSQQKVADRFRAQGLVPVDIKVADIVWHAGV
jgi:aliphatic sulfonates family ABC transporter substrate-binding protein